MKYRLLMPLLLVSGLVIAQSPWAGKRAAILGDSISDSCHVGTTCCWWEMLGDSLGMQTVCYAKNGWTMELMIQQAHQMLKEQDETGRKIDLILIFGGTNDFNDGVQLGEIYNVNKEEGARNGQKMELLHRSMNLDNSTFSGRVNNLLSFLKQHFPEARIVMLTPIHRAYAYFGPTNEQPDEMWSNKSGLFLDDYVSVLEKASRAWAVPCFDLNVQSELYPLYSSYDSCFRKVDTDRLHPNTAGHVRMVRAIQGYLQSHLPW